MYRALSTAPQTTPTGAVEKTKDGEIRWHKVTGWRELGIVKSLAEAKAKYGGSPVLEVIELH